MVDNWNIPRRATRSTLSTQGPGRSLLGERHALAAEPFVITYADVHGRECPHVLGDQQCPFDRGHDHPCGALIRTETGLDFYVTWEPLGVRERELPGGVESARTVNVRLLHELTAAWGLVTCPLCGNGVDAPQDRADFLRYGVHGGCAADAARDEAIALEAAER